MAIRGNKWHLLVAEIMLQRTRAEQVIPEYLKFIDKYKSPHDYIMDSYYNPFASLGLSWRHDILKDLCRILKNKSIPESKTDLLKLPGVGDYVAAAYRSLHLNVRDYIIDSNIVRLYSRFFGFSSDGELRRKKWLKDFADNLTPIKNFRRFNYGLIDYTRTICKVKPLCNGCVIRKKCLFNNNT